MIISRLNNRITFFSLAPGVNDDGVPIENIRTDEYSCWAEIAKSTNKEFKEVTKETTDFYVRYRQNKLVDQIWKIDFDGRIYEIVQVEEDFLNHDLTKIKGVLVK